MANYICGKCNNEIQDIDVVKCPECAETYHKWCWQKTPNCVTCGAFNKDYAAAKVNSAAEKQANDDIMSKYVNPFSKEEAEYKSSETAQNIITVSKIIFVIGVVIGAIYALVMLFAGGGLIGLLVGGLFAFFSWVSSILVRGFGELIENSQKNAYYLSKLVEKSENENKDEKNPEV